MDPSFLLDETLDFNYFKCTEQPHLFLYLVQQFQRIKQIPFQTRCSLTRTKARLHQQRQKRVRQMIMAFLMSIESQINISTLRISSPPYRSTFNLPTLNPLKISQTRHLLNRDKITPTLLTQKKKKSPFHNFQKHLITVIKKFMNFSKDKLNQFKCGTISYEIWLTFLNSRISNRKILSVIFGAQDENLKFYHKSSKQVGAFHNIFNSCSLDEIQQAQQLLRNCVVTQANTLSKHFLNSNSKISNFEDFYHYFRGFIAQLQNGPLPFRMSKSSKCTFDQKYRWPMSE